MVKLTLVHGGTTVMPLASRWAGWALAHLEFGSSVNPITTRGVDYAHPITASPPGFEKLAASLNFVTMRGSNQLSPLENRVTNECKGICRIENNEQVLLFPDNV